MTPSPEVAAAVRQIARGFDALADALTEPRPSQDELVLAVLHAWGDRGLTRAEASALFKAHHMAPQAAGGWARGDWIESRDDGLRYLTDRSRQWMTEQEAHHDR